MFTYRYAFNGMEKDDEWSGNGNMLDFGSRIYNSRLGRWLAMDSQWKLFPDESSYSYSINNPINYIDPNGELPIFINGNTFSGDYERGKAIYWSSNLLEVDRNSLPYNSSDNGMEATMGSEYTDTDGVVKTEKNPSWGFFVDGNQGVDSDGNLTNRGAVSLTSVADRKAAGRLQAIADYPKIIAKLEKDENGKVGEEIQIYSHSRGAAFSVGYIETLKGLIKENSEDFVDPENVISYSLMLAPHQSDAIDASKTGVPTYSITHDGDGLSDDDVMGSLNFFTNMG